MRLLFGLIVALVSLSVSASETISVTGPGLFLGSLRDSVEDVEEQLLRKATEVCGTAENIGRLSAVNLQMKHTSVNGAHINLNGSLGERGRGAIFLFAYPYFEGSAVVHCGKKN